MPVTEQPTLLHSAFPVTGQPIRVVVINGEPWFATADVCRILGRDQPHRASKIVEPHETQTVNVHVITRTSSTGNHETAGQNGLTRGNPLLSLISESGLYTLIMRSRKPSAKPFQQWVTAELLPSLRRGDTDLGAQRQRMSETLTEALGDTVETVLRIDGIEDGDFQVRSDGSVHCVHGRTEVCVAGREEDSGPPFGPFFRCPEQRRVGIRGSKRIRPCGSIKFIDVVRRLAEPRPPEPPATTGVLMTVRFGSAVVEGTPSQIAALLREMGVAAA